MIALDNNNLPWIESPLFYSQLKNADLSDDDKAFVKQYADEGFVQFDPKIEPGMLDEIIRDMQPHFDKIDGDDKRIQDAWKYNQNIKKLASLDTVYEKLRLLYRREPLPFQTLNFCVGTQQRTHSDMIHFNSIPSRFMCGVWIALEDITDENGPLHYYPKSHKLPFYDMLDIGVKGSDNVEWKRRMMVYSENYENFIQDVIDALGLEKATLNIKKGQAVIWAANLLHGGNKILREGASRHSQVTHYYYDNCVYYAPKFSDLAINKIFLTDIRDIKTGKKPENRYFDEVVKRRAKLELQFGAVRMLSKISHLFPKNFVNKMKTIITQ